MFFLTLDTLTWIKVTYGRRQGGAFALADHIIIQCAENDFLVLGGADDLYKLSNKINVITFDENRLWSYSHNSRPSDSPKRSGTGGSPKRQQTLREGGLSPLRQLSIGGSPTREVSSFMQMAALATPSFI